MAKLVFLLYFLGFRTHAFWSQTSQTTSLVMKYISTCSYIIGVCEWELFLLYFYLVIASLQERVGFDLLSCYSVETL